ncbi:hypothetical protein BN1095_210052 [Clostridioides difficile]|uniref:Uncharacterized protein n=1 Tax=Clostridioides difficile TaxID=1496 RepID=A0A069APM6_CLODI|nr:hypothetical protein BN1095_210052 [Clostridioides difficile]
MEKLCHLCVDVFLDSGLSIDEVAKRMDVTVEYIESVLE